jgi:ATP-dependent DNA ligase
MVTPRWSEGSFEPTFPILDWQWTKVAKRALRGDGAVIYKHVCEFGCEGIVSKRVGSPYRSGRSGYWLKIKNPMAPAVRREADED